MKLVFLDIDGVLNSGPYLRSLDPGEGVSLYRSIGEAADIDPDAVVRLNRLVESVGAYVVISSSWRHGRTVAELARILRSRGFAFPSRVLGRTPDFVPNNNPLSKDHCGERGNEIQAWLDGAPMYGIEVESFVILDDNSDMAHLADRLVLTTFDAGLEDKHVEYAIALLSLPRTAIVTPTAEQVIRFTEGVE